MESITKKENNEVLLPMVISIVSIPRVLDTSPIKVDIATFVFIRSLKTICASSFPHRVSQDLLWGLHSSEGSMVTHRGPHLPLLQGPSLLPLLGLSLPF